MIALHHVNSQITNYIPLINILTDYFPEGFVTRNQFHLLCSLNESGALTTEVHNLRKMKKCKIDEKLR